MPSTIRTAAAVDQLKFARGYVRSLLDDLAPDDWFWQPKEGITHIAWQVAHVACAEYALGLMRVRGRLPEDKAILSKEFLKEFGRGSTPKPATESPTIEEIRAVFDRVHDEVLRVIPDYTDEDLDILVEPAHPAFKTKLGGLIFASQHEMTHAGQIGLLRRLMGKEPLR